MDNVKCLDHASDQVLDHWPGIVVHVDRARLILDEGEPAGLPDDRQDTAGIRNETGRARPDEVEQAISIEVVSEGGGCAVREIELCLRGVERDRVNRG